MFSSSTCRRCLWPWIQIRYAIMTRTMSDFAAWLQAQYEHAWSVQGTRLQRREIEATKATKGWGTEDDGVLGGARHSPWFAEIFSGFRSWNVRVWCFLWPFVGGFIIHRRLLVLCKVTESLPGQSFCGHALLHSNDLAQPVPRSWN